ncbi:LexA family transcriptional regulator [Stutzerimonas nitrititolerans]|uniref:LexA family transcriptional regulator n=1 Tax=Stutzerimonas nitrititolerans TaxID=2482751 RepID=UPI0028AD8AD7|nr:XRE family transcriptional regulator [Stutzerimonas nitrititolerans]
MKKDRRPLQDWEKQECASLKAEFLAYNLSPPNGKKLTQEEAAHALGMSQGTLSSHLNGYRALNKEMAATMAKMLGIPVSRFSKRLADEIQSMSEAARLDESPAENASAADLILDMLAKSGKGLSDEARQQIAQAAAAPSGVVPAASSHNVISHDFSGLRARPEEILIPQYDVRGAMGHGQVPADYNEAIRNLVIREDVLREKGVTYTSPEALAMITGWGQSMEGTINDKDPVIVDRGVTEFIGEGVYVLTWHGLLYIKRVQQKDADHFWLISDNPNNKDLEARIDDVTIHAKVLLVWNARKV